MSEDLADKPAKAKPKAKLGTPGFRQSKRLPKGLSEKAMVEHVLAFIQSKKRGVRVYPTDFETTTWIMKTFDVEVRLAQVALRGAYAAIADRVNSMLPLLGSNVVSQLQETIAEAGRVGDLATKGRCLIALGRFAGLDSQQNSPEQQVRQLSDAALEAALEASIARKLESMPEDAFEDLMRRREAKRLAGARPMLEAAGVETSGS